MKKTIQELSIALAFVLPLATNAQVNYAVSGNTAYVTNSPGASGNVVVASTYNGYPVTSIGQNAFQGCSLTTVTIPASVTGIGSFAFYYCYDLTSVTMPDSVTSIGQQAFLFCGGLTSITIPDSVTNISGYSPFLYCSSLTNITVGVGNPAYSSLGGVLFDQNRMNLIQYPEALGRSSYAVPDSVTSIGEDAFAFCGSLTEVTIPDSVTNIAAAVFTACGNLTSVTIGSGLTSIDEQAFRDCTSLSSVTFLGNAPMADSSIFLGDTNVTVYYAPGTAGWDSFAGTVNVVTAPEFGSTAYGGSPTLFYPPSGISNTLQMTTNPASGVWLTVSNAVTLAALQLTNPPPSAFFTLLSSAGSAPNAGLALYGNLPVVFYPTNGTYSLVMSTNLAGPDWGAPVGGNAFITVQVTNAPPKAVFRLH